MWQRKCARAIYLVVSGDKIRDVFIHSFESLETLERYAKRLDDFQLASMVRTVREYARILPMT